MFPVDYAFSGFSMRLGALPLDAHLRDRMILACQSNFVYLGCYQVKLCLTECRRYKDCFFAAD